MTSIAVVGNAQSLFDRRYGREIDHHDVVARINRAAILYAEKYAFSTHGSKTDAWFVWRHNEYQITQIKVPFTMQMAYWEPIDDCNVQLYPEVLHTALQARLGAVPSTGLMVLDYLLSTNQFDKISAYGFDWKATPTFTDPTRETDQMLNQSGHLHNFELERQYCYDVLSADARLIFRF